MVLGSIVSSPLTTLSPQKALNLANAYLENAYNACDQDIALVFCHDTEVSLSHARKAARRHTETPAVIKGIATAYIDLGRLLEIHGYGIEAQLSFKKGEKLGGNVQDPGRHAILCRSSSILQHQGVAVPTNIFAENVRVPTLEFRLPEPDERLTNTPQLAYCLSLLQAPRSPGDILESSAQNWLQVIELDTDEQDRLKSMATDVIKAFKRDELKDAKAIAEVVYLAPVLNKDAFQDLFRELYSGIDHSGMLNVHQLEGIAQLIQGAGPCFLDANDLIKILELLSSRLKDTQQQSAYHMHRLTLTVSHALDAMADTKVKGLDREKLHEPLSTYLGELKRSSDPYLAYQAAYAFQALLCIPDNESIWQAALRRTGKVIQGVSGLMSAVKGLDLTKFIEGLENIQKGLEGTTKVVELVQTAYKDTASLSEGGQVFLSCLKEGFSFEHKRDWYSALRGADALIREGDLASFRKLVCEAPCRLDPAFQWGVCQRLGEIAANPVWDVDIRRSAIAFLGEVYRNDAVWGQQTSVKQWILNILMQLASSSGIGLQSHARIAGMLLQDLEVNGDSKKRALYRACRENGPIAYPMNVSLPELGGSPSLLDRVQNKTDIEGNLRLLSKLCTKERGNAIYIQPQAKSGFQAPDDARFPLMDKVKEFLDSRQKVFLLLGDSGAGKSTFIQELEHELWNVYKKKTGRIPLHINLPAIDKPEYDMIAKHLRKAEFTEPQVREMRQSRKFILICDGYNESQQTQNLYLSNHLNQPEEWDAQLIISCRSEYLGIGYRGRFQPEDQDQQSGSSLFQEAVMVPFSQDQIHAYIKQYVSLHQPLWEAEDYKQAIELIPNLKDLVRNPFLMTLSLEVLPRIVDPGLHLSSMSVTRVELYDHFVEQWLDRRKKRTSEKDFSPQARTTFESLCEEGFTQNGIDFLKRLAVAIYKEQDGQPVVEYSRFKDAGSWKDEFFSHEDMRLLREACPLARCGNQHRFIHESLLEYGLARSVFDPYDTRNLSASQSSMDRRESTTSTLSFEIRNQRTMTRDQELSLNSPLCWRDFVKDHSLSHFLEERVQQEPVFKQQLLNCIQYSKTDKRWRTAAVNAITILVRAGVQFIGADLRGIQIPGADLSYGMFDSARLQGADMRKVNLRATWLRQADLSGSRMKGAQFGELPSLTEDSEVRSCAYSPNGALFAVGLRHGNINVYATSNWEKIHTWWGHADMVRRVAFSTNGDQLASASRDQTVRLWDVETGSSLRTLTGHTNWATGVAFSPNGHRIASSSDDQTVRLWDVTTSDCLQTLFGHTDGVQSVTYSPNGTQVASTSDDLTVRLWNAETGDCSHILLGHCETVWDVAFSPEGHEIASASTDKTIRLWNLETGACRRVLVGHGGSVNSVSYSPNGNRLTSGGQDGTVRLWDVQTGTCCHTLSGHDGAVMATAFSPAGNQVASGGDDDSVILWDISSGASHFISSGYNVDATNVKCSPKGNQIASGSGDHSIRLWDTETGACQRTFRGHSGTVSSVAFSPQGHEIVSGSSDKLVRLWDLESGLCRRTLKGHRDLVNTVAFSPRGHFAASAGRDKSVRLWDLETGDCRATLNGHTDEILSVAYSPEGDRIASSSKDCTIRIWDVGTGECHRTLIGHTFWIWDIVYSPKGNQLASAGGDKTVRLFDVGTGDCRLTLTDHDHVVTSVAYSISGDLLASGSWDRSFRIWDVTSGQCRAMVENLQGCIQSLSWASTSNDYLVTGCEDGSLLKWQVLNDEDACRVRLCWGAANNGLTVTGASIRGVRGLTQLDKRLLKQRGAIGEPARKASVASTLVAPDNGMKVEPLASADTLTGQPEQQAQLNHQHQEQSMEQDLQE